MYTRCSTASLTEVATDNPQVNTFILVTALEKNSANSKFYWTLHAINLNFFFKRGSLIDVIDKDRYFLYVIGVRVSRKKSGFGGLEVACWPLVLKFAGSNPTEAVGFFQGEKILITPYFGREVKPSVPCRRFTACKRSLNVTWKSGIFRQTSSAIFRPSSSTLGC